MPSMRELVATPWCVKASLAVTEPMVRVAYGIVGYRWRLLSGMHSELKFNPTI